MNIVGKSELENICLRALNQIPRFREVRSVTLAWRSARSAEWMLCEVEPRFDILDVKGSYAVVRELQKRYRMISSGQGAEVIACARTIQMTAASTRAKSPRRGSAPHGRMTRGKELDYFSSTHPTRHAK